MNLLGRTQTLNYPILDCLKILKDLGFDGAEICLENNDISPSILDIDIAHRIRDYSFKLGLTPCSVSYHKDYINNDNLFNETKKAIRLTSEFGANIFVFSGCVSKGLADEWNHMLKRTKELVEIAEGCGIVLAEEFEPNFIVGTTENLHRLFDAIPSPNLTANVDIGHVFLCDSDSVAALKSLEGKIGHCHIENMKSGVHKHLPPDEGDMDFEKYIKVLYSIGFNGPMALDLYDCEYAVIALRAVPYIRNIIKKIEGEIQI